MKRTYKVGQKVKLPAIRREGIKACDAWVKEPPNEQLIMIVRTRNEPDVEVLVSATTGRIRAQLIIG